MPYIPPISRIVLLAGEPTTTPGELQFLIAELVSDYVELHGLRYQTLNDVMGALHGAQAEFYRRVVAPYEDKKLAENGDVYSPEII